MMQRIRIKNRWRVDKDGFLRVTADVLSSGVFGYSSSDVPGIETINGKVPVYIPTEVFTPDALKSLEGKPVTVQESLLTGEEYPHKWRKAENAARDGFTVGSVAGVPTVVDGKIRADLLITDKDTADRVVRGELVEVSAAYDTEVEEDRGVFEGTEYTGRQITARFNHILLLPQGEGRQGKDARILNKKTEKGAEKMPVTVTVQAKNGTVKKYQFTNEADKDEAERMSVDAKEEGKAFNAEELGTAMSRVEELQKQLDALSAERDTAMKTIADYKERIDKLTSAETMEAMAREAQSQKESEDLILDNADDAEVEIRKDEDGTEVVKEKVKNELQACNSFAGRRKVVVQHVLNSRDMDISQWTQDAVDGAFEALAAEAKVKAKARAMNARPVMGGVAVRAVNASGDSNFERMIRPMRAKNTKTGE